MCEPESVSRVSWSDFSSDDDSDDEVVPERSHACGSIGVDTTSSNLSLTPKKRRVSYYGVHRDKEALLEELLALQDAFRDQKFHLELHKNHHNAMEEEKNRLEKKVEYLETSGLEAALTGTPTKLKSKLKGCKARILGLETTCVTNAAAVRKLRMDTQFMKTQEVTVQREVFAQEIRRLQKCLYRLQNLYKRVRDDKNEAIRLKEGFATLTAKNPTLETSISLHRRSLEKMATESVEREAKQAEAKKTCARAYESFRGLQEESKSLMEALHKEKLTKADLTTSVNTAMHRVREAERETREKKRNAALGLE